MIIFDSDHLSSCRHFVEQLEKSFAVYLGFIDSPFVLKGSANDMVTTVCRVLCKKRI